MIARARGGAARALTGLLSLTLFLLPGLLLGACGDNGPSDEGPAAEAGVGVPADSGTATTAVAGDGNPNSANLDAGLDAALTDADAGAVPLCRFSSAEGCPGIRGKYGQWAETESLLPQGADQTAQVCARGGDDLIRELFCTNQTVQIHGFGDLLTGLGLSPNNLDGFSGFSLSGHSTSLSARSVSAINPRVIFSRLELPSVLLAADPDAGMPRDDRSSLLFVGFTRGEQFVELIVRDNVDRQLRFYLLAFRQPCNSRPGGCRPGDLLTPAVESEWLEVTLYDEDSLANTVLDCATCHQPQGPGTLKRLIMHELRSPWTHWHSLGTEGGNALMEDYLAAKGSEPLAGLSHETLREANPNSLAMVVFFSEFGMQSQEFHGTFIETEVKASANARGGNQPYDNRVMGQSEQWRELYERAQRGDAITVPYHDVKVTDADKLEAMTRAYQAFRQGDLARGDLPDIRDVYPDDPLRLAHMGVMTEPGQTGEDVLTEACSLCHNDRLDQSLSRARFNPDLTKLNREQKDLAIERLLLPADDPRAMPPPRLRRLSPEARDAAIEALRQ